MCFNHCVLNFSGITVNPADDPAAKELGEVEKTPAERYLDMARHKWRFILRPGDHPKTCPWETGDVLRVIDNVIKRLLRAHFCYHVIDRYRHMRDYFHLEWYMMEDPI